MSITLVSNVHSVVHADPEEYNHEMAQLVHIQCERALVVASHDYILEAHMNEHKLFNIVMFMI